MRVAGDVRFDFADRRAQIVRQRGAPGAGVESDAVALVLPILASYSYIRTNGCYTHLKSTFFHIK